MVLKCIYSEEVNFNNKIDMSFSHIVLLLDDATSLLLFSVVVHGKVLIIIFLFVIGVVCVNYLNLKLDKCCCGYCACKCVLRL